MNHLVLIDGHNLLFRMFYGIPKPVYNAKGEDIKSVMGFASGVLKLVKTLKADRMLVVFDSITSISDRKDTYDDYKQNRIDYSQMPDDENPFTQLPKIFQVLEHMNIAYHIADGYEADDYIASICQQHEGYRMTIVSTDSDFNQLVNERVTIFNPRGKDGIFYTPDQVFEKFNVHPNQIVDYKSLIGDTADNIPGVKGIGPKRAAEILSYGTLENILSKNTECPEKFFEKLEESRSILERNRMLIQMRHDVECPVKDEVLKITCDVNQRPLSILEACGLR
ncbi:MAG: 5'-3' exonuclease [Clostridia bacterium]|nr:5'-3' exonuclease [Clostridia bacterium]